MKKKKNPAGEKNLEGLEILGSGEMGFGGSEVSKHKVNTKAKQARKKEKMNTQLDRLDQIADEMRANKKGLCGSFSTGEQLYVALSANRTDILKSLGYSLSAALARLGPDWTAELIARHQYK